MFVLRLRGGIVFLLDTFRRRRKTAPADPLTEKDLTDSGIDTPLDHLALMGPVAIVGLAMNHGMLSWLFRVKLGEARSVVRVNEI